MSSHALYTSLLRPPVIHILRAAGFHTTKPAVLDTLVDLAARYITLLASRAAAHAQESHNDHILTITDVRMALQDVGALWPQKSAMEEHIMGEEDMRGVEAFVKWMKGDEHREIRRIAGLIDSEAAMPGVDMPTEKEDFLTGTSPVLPYPCRGSNLPKALKKKHNKTGEVSRFQGTALGTHAEDKPIRIEGGPIETIQDWSARVTKLSQEGHTPSSGQPRNGVLSILISRKKSQKTGRTALKNML
ncbi:MAG: hypothetical protein Q9203_007556 [Teloschistes exilis]